MGNEINLTLEQAAGVETFEDSGGNLWYIKVHSLKDYYKLAPLVGSVLVDYKSPELTASIWAIFVQRTAYNPTPDWKTAIRRMLSMPDYSRKYVANAFPGKDRVAFRDAVVLANFDMTIEEMNKIAKEEVEEEERALKEGRKPVKKK